MKELPSHSPEYFRKFSTAPVLIKPFDPRSQEIARRCIDSLKDLLSGLTAVPFHRGSTLFGIAGKGDVELSVHPADADWYRVLERLEGRYGKPGNVVGEDYVRFNGAMEGYEVEIIVLRGYRAEVDQKLTEYLLAHPELLDEYEQLKRRYAYSRREYQIQKDQFFRRVVAAIPEC